MEASDIDILGNPLIPYADALSEIKGELLYTDILDFEADGENLIVTPDPSEVNKSSVQLIAPYTDTYTDDYHTSMSFILDENGAFSATGTENYGGYSPIASLGLIPESVTQRVDGTIWVTINENETYTICPPEYSCQPERGSDVLLKIPVSTLSTETPPTNWIIGGFITKTAST